MSGPDVEVNPGMPEGWAASLTDVITVRKSEYDALRSQVAELQKDVQVARGQYQGACDIIRQLQKQGKQEPALHATVEMANDYGLIENEPLYRLPPNTEAMVERAKAEEKEVCAALAMGMFHSAAQGDEIADAIRARK